VEWKAKKLQWRFRQRKKQFNYVRSIGGGRNARGMITIYFKVNGQGRTVEVKDESIKINISIHTKE
jgi:pyruvate carboxylase